MKLEGTGLLLRIYLGENDQWQGRPLYQAIVERMREKGLAGATVLRGIEGFGAKQHLHTTRILRLSEDLPILIEAVDSEEKIRAILPEMDEMLGDGLITLERARVILYRPGNVPDDERSRHRIAGLEPRAYLDRGVPITHCGQVRIGLRDASGIEYFARVERQHDQRTSQAKRHRPGDGPNNGDNRRADLFNRPRD